MKEIEFFKLGLYEGEIGSDALARKKEFGHIMTQTRKRAKGDVYIAMKRSLVSVIHTQYQHFVWETYRLMDICIIQTH